MPESVAVSDRTAVSDHDSASPSLSVRQHLLEGHPVIEVAGVLDRDAAPRLRSVLYEAVVAAPLVIVDMSAVSDVRVPAAGALALAAHAAAKMGGRVVTAAAPARVRSMLAAIGADAELEHHPSVTAAVHAGRTGAYRYSRSGSGSR